MDALKRRNKRIELWEKCPNCYWCEVITIDPYRYGKDNEQTGTAPSNLATLDHVFVRADKRRIKGKATPVVLACFKCNQERSHGGRKEDRDKETKVKTTVEINKMRQTDRVRSISMQKAAKIKKRTERKQREEAIVMKILGTVVKKED